MARKRAGAQADTTIGPISQVTDLTAGVNLRPSSTNIKPNQARRLVNTLISNVGELGTYPGWLSFSTASLGTRRAQGGKRIYLAAATFTLAGDNGSVYKPSDAGVWGAAVLSGLNPNNAFDFVYDRDIVAVFDSASVPQKSLDGTTWSTLGMAAPGVAPGLSAVAGGALVVANTYEVSYAFYNSVLNQVGNASTRVQQATAGANLTVRVAVTASADAQVTNIKIYVRNVTAGETVLRLQGTYSNTTTNRDITVSNWDGQEEEPTDHTTAVPMSFGCVWKNRWWGRDATVKNRLRFSQIFTNMSWPATFFVDIPFERGEDITMMIPLGDVLIVFGYTKFYLIIGQTSLDFEVRPALGSQAGAFGFRAADVLENGIAHAAAPGVYLFNGSSDTLLSYPIDPAWQDMMDKTTQAELALLPLTYHKIAKELRIAVPSLYPTGGRGEWVMDLNRTNTARNLASQLSASPTQDTGPAWFATDRTIGCYIQWDGNEAVSGSQGRLFSLSPTIVKMYEERVGTSADGSNLTVEYDGYMVPFGLQSARVIDSYLEYQPCAGTLTVDLKVDGRRMGTQSFDLGANLTRYGTAIYGTSVYSGGTDRASLPVMWPDTAEGHTAQLLVKYVGKGDFKLFTYGHNVFAESLPRGI